MQRMTRGFRPVFAGIPALVLMATVAGGVNWAAGADLCLDTCPPAPDPTPGGTFTEAVALGDLDGDGDLDMVEGNRNSSSRVYLNDGTGTFADTGQRLGVSTTFIALGDVDGDGDLDMVLGNKPRRPHLIYLNDGTGVFTDSGKGVGTVTSGLPGVLADVDGDGDLDFVAWNSPKKLIGVYLNDGNGIFTSTGYNPGMPNTRSIALGDVDGDGDPDVVLGTVGANRIYRNNGKGIFTDTSQKLGDFYTRSTALGDVDGDGDLDVVTGNDNDQPGRVYLNDGNGTFTDSGQKLGHHDTFSVVLVDVDGDGDLDLVEGNSDYGQHEGAPNHVYLNDGTGFFTGAAPEPPPADSFSYHDYGAPETASFIPSFMVDDAAIASFFGGGTVTDAAIEERLDITVEDVPGEEERVDNSTPSPGLNTVPRNSPPPPPITTSSSITKQRLGTFHTKSVALGDVDGDGDLDLISGNIHYPNRVYRNDGTGLFSATSQLLGRTFSARSMALADLDGDDDLDVVVGTRRPEPDLVYLNDGTGFFTDTGQELGDFETRDISLLDLDGDGDVDLVTGEQRHGKPHQMYRNNGKGVFTVINQKDFSGARPNFSILTDVNGDNKPDLVAGGGNLYGTRVYLNDGTGTFLDTGQKLGDTHPDDIILIDLDADGDPELIEENRDHNPSLVFLNDGTGTFTDTGQKLWRKSVGAHFFLGDLDSDGDPDLVTRRFPDSGRVHWNDGNGTFIDSGQDLRFRDHFTYPDDLIDVDNDGDLDLLMGGALIGNLPRFF